MRIKVLWIDDEYKSQFPFISLAEQEGIDITPCESSEEGMMELNNNLELYHAVILDAKVKNEKDDRDTNLRGLKNSRDQLNVINETRYLPYFIYTGQPDYQNSSMFRDSYGEFYTKPNDQDKLLSDIIDRVVNSKEYVIQRKYAHVLKICDEKYIGKENFERLLKIFKYLEGPDDYNEDIYNIIRKIVEASLKCVTNYGILPNAFINVKNEINLTWPAFFLQGKKVNLPGGTIISSKMKFPIMLGLDLYHLKDISNMGSHDDSVKLITDKSRDEVQKELDDYLALIERPYIIKSLIYKLLDVLQCFKSLIDKYPDKKKNMEDWIIEKPSIHYTAKIEKDKLHNYHCGNYLLWKKYVEDNKFKIGDDIEILESEENRIFPTKSTYPYFAKKFIKKKS